MITWAVPPMAYPGEVKKVLALDLDQTLLHTYTSKPTGYTESDHWKLVHLPEDDGSCSTYYTLLRPFAREFLDRCMQHYHVIFYTAATRDYAEPLVKHLCPHVSSDRIFCRDDCAPQKMASGVVEYMKNLPAVSGASFDPRSILILDDKAPENVIPCENGIACSPFEPLTSPHDGSEEAIRQMLDDRHLQSYAELLCSHFFLDADDIRLPLAVFSACFQRQLGLQQAE